MGEPLYGSDIAKEIFIRVRSHSAPLKWTDCVSCPRRCRNRLTDDSSHEEAPSTECEGNAQRHLISIAVFRQIEKANGNDFVLEKVLDNVDICLLDDMEHEPHCEWHAGNCNEQKDIRATMAENNNAVYVRHIIDWSRSDGNVLSSQIAWSGCLADGHRVLQLWEGNSTTSSIELIQKQFWLHPHLRIGYIARHRSHPRTAALAALCSLPTVIISKELGGAIDGEGEGLICSICHDILFVGVEAKQLPCGHLYHWNCIFDWFCCKLDCRLCRMVFG